jgi:hypothetical protein
MSANKYFDSLLWSAFQQINKNIGERSEVEREFEKFFTKFYTKENKDNTLNQLSHSYRNTFEATNQGIIFIQNGKFDHEFECGFDKDTEFLGRGAVGKVYRATHKFDNQKYAVKIQQYNHNGIQTNLIYK